jgi:hypothetical protein
MTKRFLPLFLLPALCLASAAQASNYPIVTKMFQCGMIP